MKLSEFGEKITARSGIMELMDDLGKALSSSERKYMLGGGNPAHIPQINELWRKRMKEVLANENEFEKMVANYDTSQGKIEFLETLAELLNKNYNWNISAKNIGLTNGSQSGFFILFNILSGRYKNGMFKKILLPITPEYIGYADQSIYYDSFKANKAKITEIDDVFFKYNIDFDNLDVNDDIAGICVSRPTNPTGNVLSDEEVKKLSDIALNYNIPLLIDNAYGVPFPSIIFEDINPFWNENTIISMSLSKLGLPSVRTGIFIAKEGIIDALSCSNAIISLSTGSIGQVITQPMIKSGEIIDISKNIIKPYYHKKSLKTVELIKSLFGKNIDYKLHLSQGALFLWIWFRNLPVKTDELYYMLKEDKVLVVPGKYFFYGLKEKWEHKDQCIRITYSQDEDDVEKGIEIMAKVINMMV